MPYIYENINHLFSCDNQKDSLMFWHMKAKTSKRFTARSLVEDSYLIVIFFSSFTFTTTTFSLRIYPQVVDHKLASFLTFLSTRKTLLMVDKRAELGLNVIKRKRNFVHYKNRLNSLNTKLVTWEPTVPFSFPFFRASPVKLQCS